MAANYRVYKTDADKVKVYEQRIRQAENFNAKWHPAIRAYWNRYEAHHTDKTMTGNGHYVSGATPMVIGNVDSQFSSMTSADIDLVVTPKGKTTEDEAYVATAALSEEFFKTKAQDRGNVAVKDGLIGGISRHHQACAREYAVPVRAGNSGVHLRRPPEIVGVHDQLCSHNSHMLPGSSP